MLVANRSLEWILEAKRVVYLSFSPSTRTR